MIYANCEAMLLFHEGGPESFTIAQQDENWLKSMKSEIEQQGKIKPGSLLTCCQTGNP